MRFGAKKFGHGLDDFRHPGHTTDKNDFVNLAGIHTCIFQRGLTWLQCTLNQFANQLFQIGTRQLDIHVLRA